MNFVRATLVTGQIEENYVPCAAFDKGPRLALVEKGSPDACIFQYASMLATGQTVPLTLLSHPGCGLVPQHSFPKRFYNYTYVEIGLGPADIAISAHFKGQYLLRTSDERCFDGRSLIPILSSSSLKNTILLTLFSPSPCSAQNSVISRSRLSKV